MLLTPISAHNLSARLLTQLVPQSCYQPETELQRQSLAREEKVAVNIADSPLAAARRMAELMVDEINGCLAQKGSCVMCAAAGNSDLQVLEQLAQLHQEGRVSFEHVELFVLCEVMPARGGGLPDGQFYNMRRLCSYFLDHIDMPQQSVHAMNPESTDVSIVQYCRNYEQAIEDAGGIDVMLCQLCDNGGLEYNIPGSAVTAHCRLVLFDAPMCARLGVDAPNAAINSSFGLTLGMWNIMRARHVFVPILGPTRAWAARQSIEGPVTSQVPGSYMQLLKQVTVCMDLPAASQLTRIATPWLVTKWNWNAWWVTRAAMWLCQQLDKPILKLSNEDYSRHELTDLLNAYGTAQAVNLVAYNWLVRTTQIWPAALRDQNQRNADVSSSRVLVLSPQPDDAILGMGATLRRMVCHGRQVHVAFVTSGDLNVNDDELEGSLSLYLDLAAHYGWADDSMRQHLASLLAHDQSSTPGPDMRYVRGQVFESEAVMGLAELGIDAQHIHSIDLPCYAQAPQGNGPVTQADVDALKRLIMQIKPDHLFLGYDPGDSHGIHERCASVAVMAIDQLAGESFMQQCRVWVYRGVRSDWVPDFVDMATAIDPTERIAKRMAVYAHQSQAHNAHGDKADASAQELTWQQSQQQVNALGQAFRKAGIGAFGSCEGFVEYAFRPGTGKLAEAGPLI